MTEGESMVEKCGLAACVASNCGYTVEGKRVLCDDAAALGNLQDGYGKPLYQQRCDCRESARAVIEALLEPDADTVAFGAEAAAAEFDVDLKTLANTEFMTFIAAAKAAYIAMLRTALSQPNEEGEGK